MASDLGNSEIVVVWIDVVGDSWFLVDWDFGLIEKMEFKFKSLLLSRWFSVAGLNVQRTCYRRHIAGLSIPVFLLNLTSAHEQNV